MLKIEVKEGENIDRALKRYKAKFLKTKTHKFLRELKEFKKPSVRKREVMQKAKYKETLRSED